MENSDKYTLQSVDNALRILEYFQTEPNPTLTDISTALGMGKSSAFRLLSTLAGRGFVVKNRDGRYSLGIKNVALGRIVNDNTKELRVLRPLFTKLVEYTGEDLHYVVWCDELRVVVQEIITFQPSSFTPQDRWAARFAHMTSTGMALLSLKSDGEVEDYIRKAPLAAATRYSIADPEGIREDIRSIRERGYAVNDRRFDIGVTSVAVPLFDRAGGVAGAVSISGKTESVAAKERDIVSALMNAQRSARELLR